MKKIANKSRFVELRASGSSYSTIAAELGISKQTAIAWSRELKLEIDNLQALELDGVRRKLKLHLDGRVELLGDLLGRLRDEFLRRDLSSVPTERLLERLLQVSGALQAELSSRPVKFSERYQTTMEQVAASADIISGVDSWPA